MHQMLQVEMSEWGRSAALFLIASSPLFSLEITGYWKYKALSALWNPKNLNVKSGKEKQKKKKKKAVWVWLWFLKVWRSSWWRAARAGWKEELVVSRNQGKMGLERLRAVFLQRSKGAGSAVPEELLSAVSVLQSSCPMSIPVASAQRAFPQQNENFGSLFLFIQVSCHWRLMLGLPELSACPGEFCGCCTAIEPLKS